MQHFLSAGTGPAAIDNNVGLESLVQHCFEELHPSPALSSPLIRHGRLPYLGLHSQGALDTPNNRTATLNDQMPRATTKMWPGAASR